MLKCLLARLPETASDSLLPTADSQIEMMRREKGTIAIHVDIIERIAINIDLYAFLSINKRESFNIIV